MVSNSWRYSNSNILPLCRRQRRLFFSAVVHNEEICSQQATAQKNTHERKLRQSTFLYCRQQREKMIGVVGSAADADPNSATKFVLLIRSPILSDKKLKFQNILLLFKKSVYFKGTVQREFSSVFLHIWIGLGLNKNRFWF